MRRESQEVTGMTDMKPSQILHCHRHFEYTFLNMTQSNENVNVCHVYYLKEHVTRKCNIINFMEFINVYISVTLHIKQLGKSFL